MAQNIGPNYGPNNSCPNYYNSSPGGMGNSGSGQVSKQYVNQPAMFGPMQGGYGDNSYGMNGSGNPYENAPNIFGPMPSNSGDSSYGMNQPNNPYEASANQYPPMQGGYGTNPAGMDGSGSDARLASLVNVNDLQAQTDQMMAATGKNSNGGSGSSSPAIDPSSPTAYSQQMIGPIMNGASKTYHDAMSASSTNQKKSGA